MNSLDCEHNRVAFLIKQRGPFEAFDHIALMKSLYVEAFFALKSKFVKQDNYGFRKSYLQSYLYFKRITMIGKEQWISTVINLKPG